MHPLVSAPIDSLAGEARVPGDKSISHRALLLGAAAVGETRVDGLLEGDDVLRTMAALRALGAAIERDSSGVWHIAGRGVGGLSEPDDVLDVGNSGTGARLLAGLLATHPFTTFLTGDESLRRRPMGRVSEPLSRMGAGFLSRGSRLPMAIVGAREPVPIEYRLPVPSAQVKSAILLAGLNTPGRTTVIESQPTRDHSERMLVHFGASIETAEADDGAQRISLVGQPELGGRPVSVPADPSSAAFPVIAALLIPGSRVTLPGVGINPRRSGLYDTLLEMGATLEVGNRRSLAGEPVADIMASCPPEGIALEGVRVPPERAPSMIDEYPILAVAAACARGKTRLEGLGELRVKESDRLAAIAEGLALCGVAVEVDGDALVIEGCGGRPLGPAADATVATHMDHRIAMAFLVMGMAVQRPVRVDSGGMIETSFPGFGALMNDLGARIGPPPGATVGQGRRAAGHSSAP